MSTYLSRVCYNRSMKPSIGGTKAEREKILKKELGEQTEKIEAMGQENEHQAAKWVKEEGKRIRKEEQKKRDDVTEQLYDSRHHIQTYKEKLLEEMRREMAVWSEELPKGYGWFCQGTSKGIALYYHDQSKQWYGKGLIIANDPKYDLNGIARLIVEAVDTAVKQSEPVRDDGIIVPYK